MLELNHLFYMNEAVSEAIEGIKSLHGGPFGSVIIQQDPVSKEYNIVGRGHNRVILLKDPTCHGEMEAIRDACKNLGTFDLRGCILYTTAEPCPMCLSACMWANIQKIYYGCTREETDCIGFRDDVFYKKLNLQLSDVEYVQHIESEACHDLFNLYLQLDHDLY